MIDWRDYSYYPETAAELIRQEMDDLLKKAPYPDEEWLTDEAYKEYEALQSALRSAQSAYDDAHIIC